jgi:hypothetical protein
MPTTLRRPLRKGLTSPLAGDVHVNTLLTNFSQLYMQSADNFVAMRAFPNVPSVHQSDLYQVWDRHSFNRDEAEERADGTESQGVDFDLSTSPFFAKVYAVHKDVTDRQRANADSQINLEQAATRLVSHKLLIKRERIFAARFMGTGIWTTSLVGNAAPGAGQFLFWSAAASEPIAQFRDQRRAVQILTGGYMPNKLLIGRGAWNTLLENDSLLGRVIGGATTAMPAAVTRQLIASLLELEEIFIIDAVYTTTKKGEAVQVSTGIADDDALLYYAPNTIGDQPSAGTQFSWTGYTGATPSGSRIKRFRMEETESDRIEGTSAFGYEVTGPDLGVYFSNVTAP